MSEQNCVFCDILNGKNETKVVQESSEFVIFKDIKPSSKHHYLIITKTHYDSINSLNKSHGKMILQMEEELKGFFKSKGISTTDALFGFHLPPFISVSHLHMHGISPRSEMGFLSRFIFWQSSPWFKNAREAQANLR